jgi:hypothetical protein
MLRTGLHYRSQLEAVKCLARQGVSLADLLVAVGQKVCYVTLVTLNNRADDTRDDDQEGRDVVREITV